MNQPAIVPPLKERVEATLQRLAKNDPVLRLGLQRQAMPVRCEIMRVARPANHPAQRAVPSLWLARRVFLRNPP
jgi:hypothetical protein